LITSVETTEAGAAVAVIEEVFDLEPALESLEALLPRAAGAMLILDGGYDTCIELV
jgi:hypothetical protein